MSICWNIGKQQLVVSVSFRISLPWFSLTFCLNPFEINKINKPDVKMSVIKSCFVFSCIQQILELNIWVLFLFHYDLNFHVLINAHKTLDKASTRRIQQRQIQQFCTKQLMQIYCKFKSEFGLLKSLQKQRNFRQAPLTFTPHFSLMFKCVITPLISCSHLLCSHPTPLCTRNPGCYGNKAALASCPGFPPTSFKVYRWEVSGLNSMNQLVLIEISTCQR